MPESQDDTRAFRVTHNRGFQGFVIAGAITIGDTIEEIPISRGVVQEGFESFNYVCMAYPVIAFSNSTAMEICLYRPGFETVKDDASGLLQWWHWCQKREVRWRKAADFVAQQKAIDDVVEGVRYVSDERIRAFLASEYRRVANLPELAVPEGELYRRRLIEKAERLEHVE